jgi:hypothetical protein
MRAIVLALTLVTASTALADDVYLATLLHRAPYRAAWQSLMKYSTVPGWIVRYGRVFDGPSQPVRTANIAGATYTVADVCKPHDCEGDHLTVAFAPGASEAWARLTEEGRARYLGQPPEAVRRAFEQ